MHFSSILASSLALISWVKAAPATSNPNLGKRCTNSATDRSCWGDYDLSTNYYDEAPDTGVVVEYWFELVNSTLAPDGVERTTLTVNGTFPGPTIIANWGDTVKVHLYNGLQNNGTSLHFHGIRQNYTNQNDGVASITQCPTAPGDSITYEWRALQYGSTWYHSHYSLQAWDGVLGGIIINGPATANYDEDLGNLFLNDWSHETADVEYLSAELNGPPTLDNGLINGTNVYGDLGQRFNVTFSAGATYRIRLVNAAIDTHFKFMIDNHNLTVISADLVPIVPYDTQVLSIGMGERYDIVVTASETSGNYWLRAIAQVACSENDNPDNIKGIVMYDSTNTTEPNSSAYDYDDNCDDEDLSNLVPYLALDASAATVEDDEAVTISTVSTDIGTVGYWYMGGTTFLVDWSNPTLEQILDGANFTTQDHVIEVDDADEWVYFVIDTTNAQPHPIHLHGHDFYILAQGDGTFSNDTTLNLTNPPRRDVAMLPGAGYLVIAFVTDNPGAWLMHCHIGWHTDEGLALQILERKSEIPALIDTDVLNSTCAAWDAYGLTQWTGEDGI
ncbi:related to laccase precursor [Phialocephala subalpina]|uniref:laccase n=1 Tax=Phialocephala subalpina TaxID=576137 RepID=A0A1L7XSI6_9HELO|nr:related to laccase precursor [Phialocephala subalpina]